MVIILIFNYLKMRGPIGTLPVNNKTAQLVQVNEDISIIQNESSNYVTNPGNEKRFSSLRYRYRSVAVPRGRVYGGYLRINMG